MRSEPSEIILDPARVEQLRRAKRIRYNTVTVPALRLIGYNLLALLILCHNTLILESWSPRAFITWLIAAELFGLLSWLVLRRYYARSDTVDLGFVFLVLDLIFLTAAIYVSGGDRSWLFLLLLVRVADQTNTTFRRVLFFAHASTLCYLGMLLWLHFGEGYPIAWQAQLAKLFILYVMSIYVSLTARTAEGLRRRSADALRLARAGIVAKTEFLAKMSHELRTPLNSVIGFADILIKRSHQSGNDRDRIYLQRIGSNARMLLRTLEHILELANIEAGKLTLTMAPVDLRALIPRLLAAVGTDRLGDLTLTADIPPRVTPLRTDETRLQQILEYLLSNALTFTDSGGVIVRVIADAEDQPAAIEIIDTGPGIPDDRLDVVFEAFEQGDNTTARTFEGAGLGLSLARSLAEPLGFQIEVESELGKGSTFRVLLRPVSHAGSARVPTSPAYSTTGR